MFLGNFSSLVNCVLFMVNRLSVCSFTRPGFHHLRKLLRNDGAEGDNRQWHFFVGWPHYRRGLLSSAGWPFSQCASRFSAVMKFGAGAGEDPFAQSESFYHGVDQQVAVEGFHQRPATSHTAITSGRKPMVENES